MPVAVREREIAANNFAVMGSVRLPDLTNSELFICRFIISPHKNVFRFHNGLLRPGYRVCLIASFCSRSPFMCRIKETFPKGTFELIRTSAPVQNSKMAHFLCALLPDNRTARLDFYVSFGSPFSNYYGLSITSILQGVNSFGFQYRGFVLKVLNSRQTGEVLLVRALLCHLTCCRYKLQIHALLNVCNPKPNPSPS